MALVVFLRGINVGGHRTFRPSTLVEQLKHLDVVNIGAAGTFVVRQPINRAQLRFEFSSRLGFDAAIMICHGREIVRLMSQDFFSRYPVRRDIVRFVSVLPQAPRLAPTTPIDLPSTGKWLVRVLVRENRFIIGLYRRQMKAIGCLGKLDQVYGAPATTRNWNTLTAIANVLRNGAGK